MSEKSRLSNAIRSVPDFPKKGIQFFDLNPVFAKKELFDLLLAELTADLKAVNADTIVGIESRGFIIGAALARELQLGFVPLRKAGKLPPPIVRESYTLEYGSDTLEMQPGSGRVILLDDVLATGGTLRAAASLCEKAGYQLQAISVVLNLRQLNSFEWRGMKARSLLDL